MASLTRRLRVGPKGPAGRGFAPCGPRGAPGRAPWGTLTHDVVQERGLRGPDGVGDFRRHAMEPHRRDPAVHPVILLPFEPAVGQRLHDRLETELLEQAREARHQNLPPVLPMEVCVPLQQQRADALAGEQQREQRAGRPAAHHDHVAFCCGAHLSHPRCFLNAREALEFRPGARFSGTPMGACRSSRPGQGRMRAQRGRRGFSGAAPTPSERATPASRLSKVQIGTPVSRADASR